MVPCLPAGRDSTQSHKEMIKKIKGKYVVLSETTGRSFGSYKTLSEAKHRLRQVEFFKRLSKHPGLAKNIKWRKKR